MKQDVTIDENKYMTGLQTTIYAKLQKKITIKRVSTMAVPFAKSTLTNSNATNKSGTNDEFRGS